MSGIPPHVFTKCAEKSYVRFPLIPIRRYSPKEHLGKLNSCGYARRDSRFMKGKSCADINVSPKIACNFPRLPSMRLTEI